MVHAIFFMAEGFINDSERLCVCVCVCVCVYVCLCDEIEAVCKACCSTL